MSSESRITALARQIRDGAVIDPDGIAVARSEMFLGLLYKAKKKRRPARQHLIEAKRIVSQFGSTPMLARIEAALAELA